MSGAADEPFRVLVVCTANVCRSPAGEHLLRASAAASWPGLEVRSAGVRALVGEGVHPATAAALGRRGVDASAFVARDIDRSAVASSDLVLTMTRRQRGDVVRLDPGALRRAFTVRELARIAAYAGLAGATPRERVAAAARLRGMPPPADDDVPDPIRGGPDAHEAVVALLERELATVVAALRPR